MKLFRFGPVGQEKPGVLTTAGLSLDVSAFGEDYDEKFFLPMASRASQLGSKRMPPRALGWPPPPDWALA
jgi:hypothetical protein